MAEPHEHGTERVDRWLWAARMFKTRSQAAKACVAGHVKCNGSSVKAAKTVRRGDHVDVLTAGGLRELEVALLHDRRPPAAVACTLYLDHTPPPPPPKERVEEVAKREAGAGRPTKRERRYIDRWTSFGESD